MDTGVLIIGAILCAILIVPFYIIINLPKKKMKKMQAAFQQLFNQNHIKVEEFDILNDLIIGLSQDKKQLVISSTLNMEENFEILDLENFNSFEVRTSAQNDAHEWVGLEMKNKSNPKTIVFLDDSGDELPKRNFHLSVQDAQKWRDKLNNLPQ